MKKSTKVLFNAYKVIFALTAIALIVTYVRGLISPTATNVVISGNDWFTLGYMSVVYMLISEKEKNASKRQINPRPSESKNLAEYFGEVRKVSFMPRQQYRAGRL